MIARFFVLHLDRRDHRPVADVEYEIQVLNEGGQAAFSIYLDSTGEILIAERNDPTAAFEPPIVPQAVIEAARSQPRGKGDYVDNEGNPVMPF